MLKLLICTHKSSDFPKDGAFVPIQVGKDLTEIDLEIQRDNNGDNISYKNETFCELTAIYWAWKNLNDYDHIGLFHYRRFFSLKDIPFKEVIYKEVANINNYHLDKKKIYKLLKKNDIILSKKKIFPHSVSTDYCICHYSDDLRILRNVINDMCPEYNNAFINVFNRNNKISPYNMFISNRVFFDEYCRWLFSILFEVEKRINITNYTIYQARIFGFMGERLLNMYVYHHQMKVKYVPIIAYIDGVHKNTFLSNLENLRANLAFSLIKRRKLVRQISKRK